MSPNASAQYCPADSWNSRSGRRLRRPLGELSGSMHLGQVVAIRTIQIAGRANGFGHDVKAPVVFHGEVIRYVVLVHRM
jgi:hypothetical protein